MRVLRTFVRSDTFCLWNVTITDPSNKIAGVAQPFDLTGMTVTLHYRIRNGATQSPITGAIQGAPTAGVVQFDMTAFCAQATGYQFPACFNFHDTNNKDQQSDPPFLLALRDRI